MSTNGSCVGSHIQSWPACRVPWCHVPGGRAGDALLLQVLLEAGEHSHAVPGMAGTRSCDGEAAGTCMSVVVTQAYGTRLEVS